MGRSFLNYVGDSPWLFRHAGIGAITTIQTVLLLVYVLRRV